MDIVTNDENGLTVFTASAVHDALDGGGRVYLSGRLSSPQVLPHIDQDLEMGVSYYDNFTCDTPHYHKTNYEFNYVVEGETHLYDLNAGRILVLSAGSAFLLKPNTPYVTKHVAGTKVVFFKAPGGNDKRPVDVTPEVEKWMRERI